jgi:anti-anti-sigma factor
VTSKLQISISYEQARVPVTVFYLQGDVDAGTYEELQRQARQAIEAGTRNLVLELSNVKFMSSAGLQALHNIFDTLRKTDPSDDQALRAGILTGTHKSKHLKLIKPSQKVHQTLTTTGFDMFLEIHHNLKDALKSF